MQDKIITMTETAGTKESEIFEELYLNMIRLAVNVLRKVVHKN